MKQQIKQRMNKIIKVLAEYKSNSSLKRFRKNESKIIKQFIKYNLANKRDKKHKKYRKYKMYKSYK